MLCAVFQLFPKVKFTEQLAIGAHIFDISADVSAGHIIIPFRHFVAPVAVLRGRSAPCRVSWLPIRRTNPAFLIIRMALRCSIAPMLKIRLFRQRLVTRFHIIKSVNIRA